MNSNPVSWFLRWTLASCLGAGAGVISWVSVGSALQGSGEGPESPVVALLAGAAFGAVFGLAQWLVLRRDLPHANRWILACVVGYGIDFVMGATLLPSGTGVGVKAGEQILLGALLGVAVALPPAIVQWLLVLKGRVLGAVWWIPVSLAAWALGFAISFALRILFGELTFVAGPVVAIALTGLGLRRLLRRGAESG